MSATHTARIFHFPRRPLVGDAATVIPAQAGTNPVRDRCDLGLDIARDIARGPARDPGGDEPTQAERVAALLTAMEDSPLMRPCLFAARDLAGTPWVDAVVAGRTFRLFPDDCRLAADALIAEQAFPGCVGLAGDLRETANRADARARLYTPGRLADPAAADVLVTVGQTRLGSGRPYRITGAASTVAFGLMILCAAVLAAVRTA